MFRSLISALLCLVALPPVALADSLLPGFEKLGPFDEQVRWSQLDSGVRVLVDAPAELGAKPRLLVIFATPNGNTLEQTLGCKLSNGLDWRHDIQHVAAQIRRFREIDTARDVILAVVQSPKLSWPSFRRDQPGAGRIIRGLVDELTREVAADRVVLSCHSGGGSFIFGYLNEVDALSASIERIVFLDANYSYSDEDHHGDKLLAWLGGDPARHLINIAYDDREIRSSDGKKIVSPTGGTFRATDRMLKRLRKDVTLTDRAREPFRHTSSPDGRIQILVHLNPENKILHTALVGEMNGLLHGLTLGTKQEEKWGRFGGPRAYTKWVQPQPFAKPAPKRPDAPARQLLLPKRPGDVPTGSEFEKQIAPLSLQDREKAVRGEILRGNVPAFLRNLVPIEVTSIDATGKRHRGICYVTADYLAVGTDDDFFRLPITPRTAVAIADALDCSLMTAKLSDDVHAAAEAKLQPRPLTKDRQAVATFLQHHRLIEEQLRDQPRGSLVAGIKKDVVLSNRLKVQPHKVAIYGWHYPSGQPIQPLYVGHFHTYVDYSHGVRLLAEQMTVDGKPCKVSDVLKDETLCSLLSNEGPIDAGEIRKAAQW